MEYYEEFSMEGKNIIYIDFSNIKTAEVFSDALKKVELAIEGYPKGSLYTITNMENTIIDTFAKDIFVKYAAHNKPYVEKGVLIGLDGVKKMIIAKILNLAERDKLHIAFTKEKAIEWILQQGQEKE
jgi:hypothetical protein